MIESLQSTQIRIPPGVIDLGVGDPQFDLLPLERIRRAAEQCFARNEVTILQYGTEQGDVGLRQALAQSLSPAYGCPVDPDGLFITNGASMGLALICTLFTRPGDLIFVEEPSYFLALRIFADHGLRPVAIPVDEDGLIIEALEAELKRAVPALLYTIPTFQNPSGYTLSAERRARLAELSQAHGFLVVADEVYQLLGYGEKPPAPMAGYTRLETVFSLGSFSKILAPGLRLGWIQAHPGRLQKISSSGLLASGGGLNPFTSAIVRSLVESGGLVENIETLRSVYATRVEVMDQALQEHLPGATYRVPTGGFFFWVRFPEGTDLTALPQRAAQHKVGYRPGPLFSCQGGLENYARLCFTFYGIDQLQEGVRRLGRAVSGEPPRGSTLPG